MATAPSTLPRSADTSPDRTAGRARLRVVAVLLTFGSAVVIAVLLWHPGPARDDITYAAFAAVRDAAWIGTVLQVFGYIMAGTALGIAVCALAPRRGAGWATTGAVLAVIGSGVFAAGFYGMMTLAWYATEPEAIPVEAGTSLMTYVAGNLGRVAGLEMAGFALLNLGALALAVALLRAGSTPRWLPIGMIVVTLAQFAVPGTFLDIVQALQMATFVGIAAVLWQAATRLAQRPIS